MIHRETEFYALLFFNHHRCHSICHLVFLFSRHLTGGLITCYFTEFVFSFTCVMLK